MLSKKVPMIAIVFAITVFAVSIHAQLITGAVSGNVSDTTGAVMPGVDVKLVNVHTGDVRTTTSNELGDFLFLQLPLGTYRIEASLPGFKTFRREGIIVETGRSLAVPVQMEVGEITEAVEVLAGTPLLDPITSSVGSVMEEQKIANMPLLGRNPMSLANLIPTVRGIGFFGGPVLSTWRLAAVSIGGGDPLASSALLDGIANDKLGNQGAMVVPTVEGTREFRVITNAMSAEFGRTAGGILSVVTKSGGNEFHGSLFEYHRNDKLSANEFFSNRADRERPTLRWNQFGGNLGGPIAKDKLFFFFSYEGYRERRQAQGTRTSPTALQRSGDFSQTFAGNGNLIVIHDPLTTRPGPNNPSGFIRDPFPNNVIPTERINPVSRAVLEFYPMPNLPGLPVTGAQNFFWTSPQPIDKDSYNVRLDYNLGASRTFTGRYIYEKIDWAFTNQLGTIADTDGRNIFIPRHNTFFHYTDALSASFLMDAKAGFTYENEHWTVPAGDFDITSIGMPAELEATRQQSPLGDGFPSFSIGDIGSMGRADALGNPSTTGTASASFTKIYASHSLKFGYEHRVYRRNDWGTSNPAGRYSFNRGFTQGPDPLRSSAASGYGLASFLLGFPASASAGWRTDTTRSFHYDALFIQDDWKVAPKLTLNLGLRWEYEGALKDRFDVMSNFDPNITSPLEVPGLSLRGGLVYPGVDVPRGLIDPSLKDFGPRFGFAYHALENVVVRGGYGIMYIPTTGDGPSTGFTISTPMVTSLDGGLTPVNDLSDPFPDGILQPTGSSQGALTGIGGSVSGQLRDVQRGYSQQWNLTVQYAPWSDWLFESAWVANKGTRLHRGQTLNFLSEQALGLGSALVQSVPNPFFGIIDTGPLSGPTVPRQQLLLPFPQFTSVSGGFDFWGNSIYHALAMKVEKRFSRDYSVLMAYTASKMIDDGRVGGRPGSTAVGGVQNWNNLRAERSLSAEDIPQRLVLATMWDLPFLRAGDSFIRHVLGGWQINSITTFESGRTISLTAPVAGPGNRPNAVPGASAQVDNPTLERWFNTDAFAIPEAFTFGNVARTLPDVRSDGLFSIDFSLFKTFQITEQSRLQFRAEAFNLTNTPTFDTPGRSVGSATFGVVTATAFNPKPREFQFALRLEF
ncbi:MAG: TonB-dependent receptor domain-containing protein [Acidobacteriota bacterium]